MKIILSAFKIVEASVYGGQKNYAVSIFDKANARKMIEAANEADIVAGLNAFADELAPNGVAYKIGFIKAPAKGNRAFKGFNDIHLEMIVNEDKIDGVL